MTERNDGGAFTHLDQEGRARMVDIGAKIVTERSARATARITLAPATLNLLIDRALPKGDVLAVARVAGIMAAKETARLIPMCHPLAISQAAVDFRLDEEAAAIEIVATVKLSGRTGVEMEALTAASVAALTIYDMCKAVDKQMIISDIKVIEKRGGKADIG